MKLTAKHDIYCDLLVVPNAVAYLGGGWSGDGGGVRESNKVGESNKVELIKSGGGSRRGRSPLSPS